MQKTIEVTIKLTSDTTFDMEFYEPESGDFNRISGCDADGVKLDNAIAEELRSWVSLMRDGIVLTEQEAKSDILKYLKAQDPEYFAERSTTYLDVITSEDIMQELIEEHMRCVNRYGCDREWSCKDACDCEPGFYPEEN